jgi:hypothetical protein
LVAVIFPIDCYDTFLLSSAFLVTHVCSDSRLTYPVVQGSAMIFLGSTSRRHHHCPAAVSPTGSRLLDRTVATGDRKWTQKIVEACAQPLALVTALLKTDLKSWS